MLNITKKFFVVFLMSCVCIISFSSCSGGVDNDEAKVFINDFFAAVVEEDYEKAESFLHPDRPTDLKSFFLGIEKDENINFQDGIEIEKYTNFASSYYDSTVGGSSYELTMRTKVGESTVKFTIEIVQNESGYGIYNLNIDV